MWAVIRTGGKQYIATPGKKLAVERLEAKEGASFAFSDVLLAVDDAENVIIGTPHVKGTLVKARITRQARDRKVIVFKYRPKARWRKKKGHRQEYTEVEITQIQMS